MWIVYADPPPTTATRPLFQAVGFVLPWDYRAGFFPRRCHYKKDAAELASDAKMRGGRNVRVEKEVKS